MPSVLSPAANNKILPQWYCVKQKILLLRVQLTGTNVRLPKLHNMPPDVDFKLFHIPGKIGSSIHNMTRLPESTRDVNVRNEEG